MKVSYNWLQEYLDFQLPPVGELVAKIGAQLGAVENTVDLGAKYQGIVIVTIVSCNRLPDSDHLSVCFVDDGGVTPDVERNNDGHVQVVCGAPNVRTGLNVAWLPPGCTVPSTYDKDPFILGARNLRGAKSNGMLASAQELGLSDNHEGILELDAGTPGANFAEVYGLNDYVIDIENKMFTHRPDCFGILGIAREIAGIYEKPFSEPVWFSTFAKNLTPLGEPLELSLRNEAPDLVPRFMAVALSGIVVGQSSVKIQSYLSRVGIRPINNIVDATNYFMYLTGQPLHAYDYDKVRALGEQKGVNLIARRAQQGEKLTLLSDKEVEPRADAIVIATDTQIIGLAGVMGGVTTEIDEFTKNIILECATFEMYSIRRTSMVHGLFSEAVTRFNKGQSPLQNDRIIMAVAHAICEDGGGTFASDILDEAAPGLVVNQPYHARVELSANFINARLGLDMSATAITDLLANVGFAVEILPDDKALSLVINVPFWRTDIAAPEDVVEEVGRLHGFDNVPLALPLRDLRPPSPNKLIDLKANLRTSLARLGGNEVLTYSFVNRKLLDSVGQDPNLAYELSNAISPNLHYYRLSLVPSLLEKVNGNIRAGYSQFALYEIGKSHQISADEGATLPVAAERLAFVFAADQKAAAQYAGSAFYQARYYLQTLLKLLGIGSPLDLISTDGLSPYYVAGRRASASIAGLLIGEIGEFSSSARTNLKLPAFSAGFEVDLTALLQAVERATKSYQPLSKFPRVEQDICLRVPAAVPYAEVVKLTSEAIAPVSPVGVISDISPVDIYRRSGESEYKQITLRVSVVSHLRTLTDADVSHMLDAVAAVASERLQAERV